MKRFLIIHYGEIGLKKSNREYFVKKLTKRVKMDLEKRFRKVFDVKHILGRVVVNVPERFVEEKYVQIIGKIFGIKNFKFVYEGSKDLEKLGNEIWKKLPKDLGDLKTFRVVVKRSMKMTMNSAESERRLGAILLEKGLDLSVKLKNFDFVIDVEFFNEHGFFAFKKYVGTGGLSPNSQGKLISLISAGIDSPVASYQMMRRGVRAIFVHFHSYPYTEQEEIQHVKDLVGILGKYQTDTKLYLIKFTDVQKGIVACKGVPAKYRVVMYRRMMLKIAEEIAKKEHAKGIITGDSFGQVASQTPENLFTVHEVTTIPIFQPLIAFDKEEIIEVARKIGTYEISKLPCNDTCSMFTPKHPEIKSNVFDARDYENKLPVQDWTRELIDSAEIVYL